MAYYTPVDDIDGLFKGLKKSARLHKLHPLKNRKKQLKQMIKMVDENREDWSKALKNDLNMNDLNIAMEIESSIGEAKDMLKGLDKWGGVQSVGSTTKAVVFPAHAEFVPEPYGVVLVAAPWNYPMSMVFKPLAGALAGGNTVLCKPSEISESCSQLFAKLFPKYFEKEIVCCVSGGVPETSEVLKKAFDFIFFTGSSMVGKIIARAAAEHLTPTCLELGGKSPVYFDDDVSFKTAVKRIAWAKLMNVGQTCIAPDYILCKENMVDKFVAELIKNYKAFYGENPQKHKDYGRIVSAGHVKRLTKLIESSPKALKYGGKIIAEERYIEPTIFVNPDMNSALMQEEIFGPLLPIIPVKNVDQAIEIINDRPKPLAAYCYSSNAQIQKKFKTQTSSGGVCINDCINHIITPELPFGGVGNSGMGGGYNNKYTFELFTHKKPVLTKSTMIDPPIRYPPYTNTKLSLFNFAVHMKVPDWKKVAKWAMLALAIYGSYVFYTKK